ncbi:MAG: reverse transcriptase/maturase family protein [Candidatus Saccharimonadales bacterium]
MIQTDNDGNVLKLPRQLELDLDLVVKAVGGGRISRKSVHSFDFTTISSEKALWQAWKKFSTGKKSRFDVGEYQKHITESIHILSRDLETHSYIHGSYQPFTICDPKTRKIHKAKVRDRLVHQAIVSATEPLFEKRFIHDSYSCRVGKGTHAGVARLGLFLRQASRNNTQKVYALKCDVRQFFASIDHEILMRLIELRVDDKQTIELLRTIILSHGHENGKGIPLGNVTSQLFANIYLHELDWFMKQTLGIKHYLRYCDDFVIVSTDKAYLESLIEPIGIFLRDNLMLGLHPDKVSIRSWHQGIDFLGHVLRPYAITLRTKTKRRVLLRISENNLSSYLGICLHTNGYRLSQVVKNIAWNNEITE